MTPRPAPRPVAGALMLAVGRGEGIALFGNTAAAFLASLAPLVAFALVGAGLMLAGGAAREAAAMLGSALITLLAPAVLSHAVAVRWNRDDGWPRYAAAVNWCQWLQVIGAVAMLLLLGGRLPVRDLVQATVLTVGFYGLWLNWVVARAGLDLSRGRAAVLVLAVTGGTLLLVLAPQLVAAWLAGG